MACPSSCSPLRDTVRSELSAWHTYDYLDPLPSSAGSQPFFRPCQHTTTTSPTNPTNPSCATSQVKGATKLMRFDNQEIGWISEPKPPERAKSTTRPNSTGRSGRASRGSVKEESREAKVLPYLENRHFRVGTCHHHSEHSLRDRIVATVPEYPPALSNTTLSVDVSEGLATTLTHFFRTLHTPQAIELRKAAGLSAFHLK